MPEPAEERPRSRLFGPVTGSLALLRRWWRMVCREIDQPHVIDKVQSESGWSPRYAFMTSMSAGIAILGMLLSSPAVVIGAMLLSPLMGPILGIGFAMAVSDFRWLWSSARALFFGTVIAILFTALIVAISPLQNITSEIAARTRPNLFDLAVALFSALAGAYAMVRGRDGTIVGVAIATALMPPLAATGFGLATLNWAVFGGAFFLFFTNLTTIALAAAVMARLYGFSSTLTARQTMAQSLIVVVVFISLAVPLGFSLRQIAWEARATSEVQSILAREFGDESRLSQLDMDFDSRPILVNALVLTPELRGGVEARAQRSIEEQLGRTVNLQLRQFRVGTEATAGDAELALARMREGIEAGEQEIATIADRLSLIAGVETDEVIIDRNARRAIVRVDALPGAELETYRALERRAAARVEGWSVEVVPPPKELPVIVLADGDGEGDASERLDLAARRSLALAIWAAQRVNAPIGLAGSDADLAIVEARLREADVAFVRAVDAGAEGTVTLSWLAPDAAAAAE